MGAGPIYFRITMNCYKTAFKTRTQNIAQKECSFYLAVEVLNENYRE